MNPTHSPSRVDDDVPLGRDRRVGDGLHLGRRSCPRRRPRPSRRWTRAELADEEADEGVEEPHPALVLGLRGDPGRIEEGGVDGRERAAVAGGPVAVGAPADAAYRRGGRGPSAGGRRRGRRRRRGRGRAAGPSLSAGSPAGTGPGGRAGGPGGPGRSAAGLGVGHRANVTGAPKARTCRTACDAATRAVNRQRAARSMVG